MHRLTAVPMLVALTACATTTTRIAPVPPELVREEQARQRALVLTELTRDQQRLDDIAHPILVAGADLCQDKVGGRYGFRWETLADYKGEWREAAVEALRLTDTLTVTSVATASAAFRGGLRVGDQLLATAGKPLPTGSGATASFADLVEERRKAMAPLVIDYARDGAAGTARLDPEVACDFGHVVIVDGDINAYADGKNVIVPWAMMRFADDDELRVVVSHEVAHNAMNHLEARKKNAFLGALLGAIGDIALATQGINTGGQYTAQFAELGAMTYSQDFEREADYVGMYMLARAGLPLDNAPMFWRHFATISPSSIAYASTHPTTAERFVLLEQIATEIEEKQHSGLALLPELKNAGDGVRFGAAPLLAAARTQARSEADQNRHALATPPVKSDTTAAANTVARGDSTTAGAVVSNVANREAPLVAPVPTADPPEAAIPALGPRPAIGKPDISEVCMSLEVVDARTVRCDGGKSVTLHLVDVPDGPTVADATNAMREIVGRSAIAGLEYDRPLGTTVRAAYIFLDDGRLLNEIVVHRGFGIVRRDQSGGRYFELLLHAEEEARRAKRGLWESREVRSLSR